MWMYLYTGKQKRCPYDGDFRCNRTGNCIRSYQVCNGHANCRDGSDEENCGMCSKIIYIHAFVVVNMCTANTIILHTN